MSRPITDILREINAGNFIEEVSKEFADIVESCMRTGKKGQINIVLTVKPAKGAGKFVTIDPDYKTKSPDFDQAPQLFFVADGNTLVTDNPEQGKLPFKEVIDTTTGEIKKVAQQ